MYNPSGRYLTADYRLPFPAETFSVVLLKSVFTHMMPADVKVYLQEVGRVLRPGGCAVITYFLLNVESRQLVEAGADQLAMRLPFGDDDLCRVASLEMPEQATAHDEERIRLYYLEAGLSLTDISFGNWSGRSSLLGLQDLVIALRR
jgi:ubiquinone/menaquinone biosynthesis C-methylase UbiE